MSLLAYAILGVLVERFRQHIQRPDVVTSHSVFSAIWKRIDDSGYNVSCAEMRSALSTLVENGLIEQNDFGYCFRVTRIVLPKSA